MDKKFDPNLIRKEFPALSREIKEGVPLVYLDTTATSQKPKYVLDLPTLQLAIMVIPIIISSLFTLFNI